MQPDALGRRERARITRVGMPSARRHVPLGGSRESDEESTPASGLGPRGALQDLAERRARARPPGHAECGVVLEFLKMRGPLGAPCRRIVFANVRSFEHTPHRAAHRLGLMPAEGAWHTHETARAEMLE